MADPDYARSLDHAHRLIAKLSDHIAELHKRLDAHSARLAGHDRSHSAHSRIHGEHDARLRKLEVRGGVAPQLPKVAVLSTESTQAMAKQFRAAVRSRTL